MKSSILFAVALTALTVTAAPAYGSWRLEERRVAVHPHPHPHPHPHAAPKSRPAPHKAPHPGPKQGRPAKRPSPRPRPSHNGGGGGGGFWGDIGKIANTVGHTVEGAAKEIGPHVPEIIDVASDIAGMLPL